MHIREERKLLLAFTLVFAVVIFVLFGYGLTTKANELVAPESYRKSLYAKWTMNNGGEKYSEYELDMISDYPCVGYYTTNRDNLVIRLVDLENHTAYVINDERNKDLYFINNCSVQARKNADSSAVGNPVEYKNVTYEPRYMSFVCPYFGKQGGLTEFTGAIFKDETSFLNYVETGDTSGMEKGDDNSVLDGFGDEYDPDVPIPQLTNLSHNGFRVGNNSTTLELDLQVKSYFYGLKHNGSHTVGKVPNPLYYVDETQLYDEHTYVNIINSEIGFTGSEVVLTDETYFNCKNRLDLFSDGIEYFHTAYPSHKNLPDYDFWWHSNSGFNTWWNNAKSAFSANQDLDVALDLTGQAVTKYYVRFRELRATDVAGVYEEVPGQWYCYTYRTGKAVSVSPIEGDPNGNPVETDPIDGWQDDDGNPIYRDPSVPDINTENPLEMLKGFLELVTSLPDMVGELNLFLSDTFCFIPEKYWTLILAGVGFSVLFLVFSWFRG